MANQSLNLSRPDKEQVQQFVEALQATKSQEFDEFARKFASNDEAAWRRFVKGAYNHPITWWIGIFQLQMQMGMWGSRYRGAASVTANRLWQITNPLRLESTGLIRGDDAPLLSAIIRVNLRYRKADILGRFAGGAFTNYASTGGRAGNKRLNTTAKLARSITNFGIASYGAAIHAVGKGYDSLESVIQAVLTGRVERPIPLSNLVSTPMTAEEAELLQKLFDTLSEVNELMQVQPAPVPIHEFCARPENVDLKSICK
jgi:hypothetical protein